MTILVIVTARASNFLGIYWDRKVRKPSNQKIPDAVFVFFFIVTTEN